MKQYEIYFPQHKETVIGNELDNLNLKKALKQGKIIEEISAIDDKYMVIDLSKAEMIKTIEKEF